MADTSMRIDLATAGATPASDRPDAGASVAARPTRRERRFTPTGSGSVADLLPSPPGRGAGGEGLASRESETVRPDRRRWVHNRWIDFLTLGGGSLVVLGALAAFWPRDDAAPRVALAGGLLGFAGFWLAPVTADTLSGYDQAVFGGTLFLFIGWTFIDIHHNSCDPAPRQPRGAPISVHRIGAVPPLIEGGTARPKPAAGTAGSLRSTPSERSIAIMTKQITKHKSRRFRRFLKANEAVSALEYAILVGVIAVAVTGALVTFGGKITTGLSDIGTKVTAAVTTVTTP